MANGSSGSNIVEALETLKKKNVGQYHENVVDLCEDEYGWTETEISGNHEKVYHATTQSSVKIQQNYLIV